MTSLFSGKKKNCFNYSFQKKIFYGFLSATMTKSTRRNPTIILRRTMTGDSSDWGREPSDIGVKPDLCRLTILPLRHDCCLTSSWREAAPMRLIITSPAGIINSGKALVHCTTGSEQNFLDRGPKFRPYPLCPIPKIFIRTHSVDQIWKTWKRSWKPSNVSSAGIFTIRRKVIRPVGSPPGSFSSACRMTGYARRVVPGRTSSPLSSCKRKDSGIYSLLAIAGDLLSVIGSWFFPIENG